jgi:hypothetical protein
MRQAVRSNAWRLRASMLRTSIKSTLLLGGLIGAVLLLLPDAALSHTGNTFKIEMSEAGFSPSQLEILAGDIVIFENTGQRDHWPASNVHPTHELYLDFDARRPIPPGGAWTFIFFRPGIWGFHDHLNPQNTGQIVVLPDTHSGQNPALASPTTAPRTETGIARILSAVQRYIESIIQAAKVLVQEVFNPPVAVTQATPPPNELDTSFRAPPASDLEEIYADLEPACPQDDFECLAMYFRDLTSSYGPAVSVELVVRLKVDGRVDKVVDEHQLAHQIGRQTAESFGVNDQAFLLCPMESLNGGCQHGFFEFVLGRTETTSAAADLICQSLEDGYSSKFHFYCYHGVGHGVMMAAAYDLDRALEVCDTFNTNIAQDGCWQGVFMENVNAGMGGYSREGVFSDSDPLAPCNVLEDKYQHECYVNHAGYLMQFFSNNVERATNACLGAASTYISSCLQSIGLMVTNPVWQPALFGEIGATSFEDVAWELCTQFPDGHREQCVLGGIDNIHNFDAFELSRASAFCDTVHPVYQILCYQRMGLNLGYQALELQEVRESCAILEPVFEEACLNGAGLEG